MWDVGDVDHRLCECLCGYLNRHEHARLQLDQDLNELLSGLLIG